MVAWISNAHKHPLAFTLTEKELQEWKDFELKEKKKGKKNIK
jgi:hypothetical protein